MDITVRIPRPCCGKTLVEDYNICDWENDPVQRWKPNRAGGANVMSLSEARRDWRARGEIHQPPSKDDTLY